MKILRKLYNTKATSIDDKAKSVSFVISTNQEDRYGEIVDQKSWNFKEYLVNPIVLWGHDPSEPENVLGTASSLQVSQDGSETTATLTFDTDINPNADLIYNQIKRGTLRTVSVGFRNHTFEMEEDTPVLKDNDLLEISVVPIPANPGAIALSLKAGELNTKDAKYLLDSMRKEADLLEEEMKADRKPIKEKDMLTDEQAEALIDGMAKLTEGIAELKTGQEALVAENAELKTQLEALKPVEETDEEKTALEAQEVADKVEADKTAADEEAAKKAKEDENVAAGLNPDGTPKTEDDKTDPANGGSSDQPGAGDDEIDDSTELTDEIQAKIDAELEAATV